MYVLLQDPTPNTTPLMGEGGIFLTNIHNVYTLHFMKFTWNEVKRKSNLKTHGIDFMDAQSVFAGPTFSFEDNRFHYKEQRFVTLGLLKGTPVSITYRNPGTNSYYFISQGY